MRLIVVSLAVALAAPAFAEEKKQSQAADAQQDSKDMKGYGYGTPPGREAESDGRQSGKAGKKKAPESLQDERAVSAGAEGKKDAKKAKAAGKKKRTGKGAAQGASARKAGAEQPPSDAAQVRESKRRIEGGEPSRAPDAGAAPATK